jgi:hypothetical protein
MIVYDLICEAGGEKFEAWFASGPDYDDQVQRGLVTCPFCGSSDVRKAPMAPAVGRKGSHDPLARLQATMLAGSRWVGDDFAEQARAIHMGEAEPEKLHGRTSIGEANKLVEEGVPVLPLPFPVVPPGEVN